jgi:hypothetical protein
MPDTLKNQVELRAKYNSLRERKEQAERQSIEAANALWKFMDDRAYRDAEKPYEICGDEDAWHPRLSENDPSYDEDDLVASVRCQLPKGHQAMGYRNHLETTQDGKVWGAWS